MTMISCIKRTGEEVKFDFAKIKNAVEKAFAETDDGSENSEYAESIKVIRKLKSKFSEMSEDKEFHRIKVEDIQNSIEEALASERCFKTLTAFVKYREAHEINRNLSDAILDVISQENADIVNDNANIDGKTNVGVREAMSNEVIKNFNLSKILPKKLAKAHKKDIYIHDLGYSFFAPFTNCCLVNIEDMLRDGFRMGSAIIEPPKSLRTASTLITQIMATVSAGQYGGTSVHDVDLLLEPYVMLSFEKYRKQAERMFADLEDSDLRIRKYAEEMTEKEVKDSMQTFEYQLNSLINGHAQSIFCTLGFGMGTSWAARLVQKYILLTRMAGLGKNHETAIFPKLTFFHCEGVNKNPGDPNYDIKKLALQCSATRMYPDWLNVPKLIEITGGRKTPMGCRSFLGEWHDESGKEQYAGRFNLGVVTVNLPRIGLELKSDTTEERIKEFFEILGKKCELAHSALKLRIKYLSRASAACNPFLWQEGSFAKLKPTDKIIDRAKNGYASISLGYIGIHEALNGIFREDGQIIGNPEKIKIAQDILKFMTEKCKEWKEKEHFAYSLYGTPAETLCKTFLEQDKKDFGEVLGVTDKAYYQNSFHLDVRTQVDPFTKIDFESNFQPFSAGGFITYIESQNLAVNLEALEDIVNYAYDKVGYFGINTPADTCDECGFVGESVFSGNHYECPECGSRHINVVRRVCGYLGNPASRGFNAGKQAEVNNRVKHFCGQCE